MDCHRRERCKDHSMGCFQLEEYLSRFNGSQMATNTIYQDSKFVDPPDLILSSSQPNLEYVNSQPHKSSRMSAEKTYTGSCLCGKVTYSATLPTPPTVNFCFCTHCRKSSASLFDAYFFIPKTAFQITSGQENTTTFEIKGDSGNPVKRVFCKNCGTRVCGWCENPEDSAMFGGVGSMTFGVGTLDVPPKEIDGWKKGDKWYEEQKMLVKID